jgi:hypothetical protein
VRSLRAAERSPPASGSFVIPDGINVLPAVLEHRLMLAPDAVQAAAATSCARS